MQFLKKNRFMPNTVNTAEISTFLKGQNFGKSTGVGQRWPEWPEIDLG